MATLFFSYSHKDEALRDQLETQLAMLKHQGVIETWHDRRIPAGSEIDHSIDAHLENDDIILLLVSPDFIGSSYCYDREMIRAMQRHEAKQAVVIPVILRACDWHPAPFGKLNAVPPDGKPVTQWADRDQAFLEVAKAIRAVAERLNGRSTAAPSPTVSAPPVTAPAPRSSNLRLTKTFTQRDRDQFKHDSFDYMTRFFENSAAELSARNPGVEGSIRRIDANRFTATLYKDGEAVARCTVFTGSGSFGDGIAYVSDETTRDNSYNELLTVSVDDQAMYLTSMGMNLHRRDDEAKLSQEGAAEAYWGMFIAPLQRSRSGGWY